MNDLSRLLAKKRRRLVGLMSGTSADGVDAALVEIESVSPPVQGQSLSWELVHFVTVPYSTEMRSEILNLQEEGNGILDRLTRLNVLLGDLAADAVEQVAREAGLEIGQVDAVAHHGQTVCHLPRFTHAGPGTGPAVQARHRPDRAGSGVVFAGTLQLGASAVIAERTGVAVVDDYRTRDVAAGGTGAPLVPLVDHALFSHPETHRLALNVGGIANFTALPSGGALADTVALDTGPGNMVIDAMAELLSDGENRMDRGGASARQGTPDEGIVATFLENKFFTQAPPKAAGRDTFGGDFARQLLAACREAKLSPASTLATATWLTAKSIYQAYGAFIRPGFSVEEVIVSGGGAHNVALMEYLARLFDSARVVPSDYYGLDVDAKEAVAFAILAHLSLEGSAGNLPSVTGADHPVVVGRLTPGGAPR